MTKGTIEKVALTALGTVICSYLYYAFYLSNQLTDINKLRKSISMTQQSVQKLENDKLTIDSKIEQEKNQGSEINNAIPDIFDKKEIIKYFYELIKNDGLTADRVALTESSGKDYQSGTVSLKVAGTYNDVRNFMYKIENDKRKFVIKQLNAATDGNEYNATMTIEYYALPQASKK